LPEVLKGLIKNMNKADIVNNAIKRMSTKAQQEVTAYAALELFSQCLEEISEQVAKGNKVMLTGFGRFIPFLTQERKKVVPWRSNEKYNVKKKCVPKFYAAPKFEEKVKQSVIVSDN